MKRSALLLVLAASLAMNFVPAGAAAEPARISIVTENAGVYGFPDSESSSLISATVTDAAGDPVEGVVVKFAVTKDSSGIDGINILSPDVSTATAETDPSGVATVAYSAGTLEGDDEITATIGALTAKVSIHVTPAHCRTLPCPA